jgi:hypothetical protein
MHRRPGRRPVRPPTDPMAPLRAILAMPPDGLDAMIRTARDRLAKAHDRRSRVTALTKLSMLLLHRHTQHAELRADVDECVDLLREAITLARTQPGPRVLAERLLASTLCARQRPGDLADVVSIVGRLLRERQFDARQDGMLLSQLGMALLGESQLTTDSGMLDEGISLLEQAGEQSKGGRSLGQRLNTGLAQYMLAIALAGRYALHWSADQQDLIRAAELMAAVDTDELDQLIPGFRELRRQVEPGLGTVMSNVTGDTLDVAPRLGADLPIPDGGSLSRQLRVLGGVTSTLASGEAYRSGDLRSIDEQIRMVQDEVEGMEADSIYRGSALVLLAHLHTARFRNRQLAGLPDARTDLDAAQQYARTAFELSEPDSIGSAESLLGSCLLDRFALGLGNRADLDDAINLMRRAMTRYAPHSRNALAMCCSLSEALTLRGAQRDGSFQDIEEAERLLVALGERQPTGSPLAPVAKVRLAVFLQHRSALTGDTEDRLRASRASRTSAEFAADVGVLWAYDAASSWARWAWQHGDSRDRADAHQLAVRHLSRMARAQMGRGYADVALRRVSAGLIARAAFTLTADDRPEDAVVAAETGRAVLLSAALERDGTQLDDTVPADLRQRFGKVLARLRAAEAASAKMTDDQLVIARDDHVP